jgi:F-type H+-transporting ATPase subunit epsilon
MLRVKIINPDELVFEGETEFIVAPGEHGDLGVMPGHTPMFAELKHGTIHLSKPAEQSFDIEAGILKVRADEVTILIGLE